MSVSNWPDMTWDPRGQPWSSRRTWSAGQAASLAPLPSRSPGGNPSETAPSGAPVVGASVEKSFALNAKLAVSGMGLLAVPGPKSFT